MDSYLKPLAAQFRSNADQNNALQMKAYMKDRFEFFGIKTPQRRKIVRQFVSDHGKPEPDVIDSIVSNLFTQPQREFHYTAIELCAGQNKTWDKYSLALFEKMVLTKSWWDTVDSVNSNCIRPFFLKFPEFRSGTTKRWIESGNIWLQRLSVIFQLRYKEKTDTAILTRNINELKHSNEFFIQKAIGWALRDYAHTHPEWVSGFVKRTNLKPLSKREALKHLS